MMTNQVFPKIEEEVGKRCFILGERIKVIEDKFSLTEAASLYDKSQAGNTREGSG